MSKVTFVYPNYEQVPMPNLGLAYIISAVETEHQVNLIDLTFRPRNYQKYLISHMKAHPPDVVGISATSFSFPVGLKIASLVKQLYPQVPIIFGGTQPTLLPEESLSHSEVDAVCIGEGEETMLEYLECLEKKTPPRGVAGLWYKKDGQIVKNPPRCYKKDLDTIAFPNWDYWEVEKYMDIDAHFTGGLVHVASRGCPYDCSFCSNPVFKNIIPGQYYRLRSAENIIEEIKLNKEKYKKRGFSVIAFTDETFGLDRNQLEKFTCLYVENGLHKDFPWICETRVEIITKEWAKLVADAGCIMVSLGIETGDDYIRKRILNKGFSQKEIMQAIKHLKNNDIQYRINMMLNYPHETKSTIQSGLNLIKELEPLMYRFFIYSPLPKTELAMKFKKTNFKIRDLKITMIKIRIDKILKFVKRGIRLNGIKFILDIIKYIFSVNDCRTYPLMDPRFEGEVTQKTIHEYILNRWRIKYRHKIKK